MSRDREHKLLKLLLHAYPDRVTLRRVNDPSRGVMVGGRGVVLEPASVVRRAPLFLSIDPRDTEAAGGESRVGLASAIEYEWLSEVFPHLTQRRLIHRFDPERGRVMSLQHNPLRRARPARGNRRRQGRSRRRGPSPLRSPAPRRGRFFLRAMKRPPAGWHARNSCVARCRNSNCPNLTPSSSPRFCARRARAALRPSRRAPTEKLIQFLENHLSWKQRAALNEHAPETIQVPSGSRIRLQYGAEGVTPALAVRVQGTLWLGAVAARGGRARGGRAATCWGRITVPCR